MKQINYVFLLCASLIVYNSHQSFFWIGAYEVVEYYSASEAKGAAPTQFVSLAWLLSEDIPDRQVARILTV